MSEQQVEQSGRGCMMVLAILSIFAGIVAIGSPFLTGALVTTIIGISLLVGGVMELLMAFHAGGWKIGLSGILAILAGGLVMAHPLLGSAVIGIILIVFFLMDGVTRSILAFQLKPLAGWGWPLFSGVMSIVLAALLWRGWPLSGMWALGVLVGIRILFAGFGILVMGSMAGEMKKPEFQ